MENKYDKYKDSGIEWIGEIPEHWEVCQTKQIMKNKSIKGFPNEIVLSLYRDFGVIPKDSRDDNHNVTSEDTSNYKLVENGDFVINKMKAWQGSMAVSDFRGIISPAYYICKIFNPKVVRKYIHYLLRDESYKAEYMRLSTGMRIGQWDLNIDDFLQISTILPTLSEQQSIATYLDQKCGEVDELIALQEEMITKLQSYKQSVITEAVTKGLDKNAPLKDCGIEWIGEIPEHWSKNKIIRLFTIIGSGTTPKSSKEDNYNGSINWIQSGDINGGYIETCKNTISDIAFKEYPALKIYKAPFIIVAMYGASVGNISISQVDGCVNQACCVMNETNQNFKYLFYAMNSVKRYLIYRAEGGGQPNISQDKIKNTWLPIPPLPEIADYLDQKCGEIDELISIKQQKIEKLKDYKKSLIFECVTGKRKVC